MAHRTYRLRDTLKHLGVCKEWQAFVRRFKTFQEVVDYVQAHPGHSLRANGTLVCGVSSAMQRMCCSMGVPWYDWAYLGKWWRGWNDNRPLPPSAVEDVKRIWLAYADKHGLYTETE